MFDAIRRYPGLGITVVIALAILLKFGFWQLDRLHEKEALLAAIDSGMKGAPVPLPLQIEHAQDWNYKRVTLRGIFDHTKEIHLFSTAVTGQGGYHILTPLMRAGGVAVLVDRGWVPASRLDPATRPDGQIVGLVEVSGMSRVPRKAGFLAPKPHVAENEWFALDLPPMAQAIGYKLAPIIVEADDRPNLGGLPIGGQTRVKIPNDHLQYAVTWFGFALVLIVIYIVYIRRRR
ncbi:SURF1 family protein [Govanella unica]|uniref:SURF1-like protein n=1 Tax=Govanella unica TaxID=2975056 RepID=A0A9X3Z6U0_9PROT|nr:SURF1 family protein [Govania unica]MDA5193353.1 SURF1 family protein [Govania unica]